MTAIFIGLGSGLERNSSNILGAAGQIGGASLGRAGENVAVNAPTGNLVINRRDQIPTDCGLNVAMGEFLYEMKTRNLNMFGFKSTGELGVINESFDI